MKKTIGVLAGLCMAASVACAGQLTWFVPWAMFDHEATDLVDYTKNGILEKYDVLWQLISAGTDTVANPVDITNVSGGYVSGDDEVIVGTQRLVSSGDEVFDDWLTTPEESLTMTILPDNYQGTYVYQRVFESQTPEVGTYYYESTPVELGSDFKGSGQSVPLHDPTWTHGVKPTLQVEGPSPSVPEPATMSLLGLGALAMVLRRKPRK